MATQNEILDLIQQLIAFGFHPPKGASIETVATAWAKMFRKVDAADLERALNDEVLASDFWPKVPNLLKRMGKVDMAPDQNEGSEVLQLLLRIMRSSAYRRANEIDYDPIGELYPFQGPRVEALRRALMAAGGWKGLGQLKADLGEDARACADIRKTYQGALMESYNRHRREGLRIPAVSMGQMLAIEKTAMDQRRQLTHRAVTRALKGSPMPALIEDAANARTADRRARVARLVGDTGGGMRLLRDLGGE